MLRLVHSLFATAKYEDDAGDRHLPDCVHYDKWREQAQAQAELGNYQNEL